MKLILDKRLRGQRVVLVLVSPSGRRRLRGVALASLVAVAALRRVRRTGRRSEVTAGEAAEEETRTLWDIGEPRLAEPVREVVSR